MDSLRFSFGAHAEQLLGDGFARQLKTAQEALESLVRGECAGSDFLGWLTLTERMQGSLCREIEACATRLSQDFEAVVVVGIGGSYLGAAALLEALADQRGEAKGAEVIFLGHTLCGDYVARVLERLRTKRFAVVVISKSGTTTEPAVAFRLLQDVMRQQDGAVLPERVVVVTDATHGALHDMAVQRGYTRFVIPDDVGGRFSVLTAVGLLPLAIGGVKVQEMLQGAADAQRSLLAASGEANNALRYATARFMLYQLGKKVEVLATYTPYMRGFSEWYKQLFAESEGKEGRGLFVTVASYTTDLHSLGQYFQEGERLFFETHLDFKASERTLTLQADSENMDGLNYLSGKSLYAINNVVREAATQAHESGNLPCMHIEVPRRNAYWMGYLIYFFELSCAVSVLLQGVNPFNQPGVEAYKRNMFRMLGKPGQH